jgi:signal transduction histidine kinase
MRPQRPTVLVVDDEPEVLHSVYDLLRIDYHVITCPSGRDAVEVLSRFDEVHVVMSDQRMPGMSGVEVLRHAKQVRPEATRLLVTAYADVNAVVEAINQGSVFRYIAKPWNPEELLAVVRQAVDQHDLVVEKERLLAEKSRLVAELQEINRRLLDANRLKGAFIEVASHELNTPVAVVLGMTELWRMSQAEKATPGERAWVERIYQAGRRLAATVERMLKLTRTEELDLALDLRRAALEPMVRSAVAELAPFLQARNQTVELEIDPGLGEADVDVSKFGDILVNLLGNAIKFTPDGGTIRVAAEPAGAEEVRVAVTDQGAGIDPDDRRHLFEPFFTGFDTMHHSSGEYQFCKRGIGLGLCLVKTFVGLHGGEVEVSSTPGRGSTFGFTLPRRSRSRTPDRAVAV